MALDLTVPDLGAIPEAMQSLYVERDGAYFLDVAGVPDVSKLESSLKAVRDEAKAAKAMQKELEAKYAGIEPDKYKAIMSKFENDEEANLIAAGKMNEVIEKRTQKRDAEWQKQIDALAQERDAEKSKTEKFMGRVLDDQIRAAVNGKVHEFAVEDALYRARQMFTLDENGLAVQREQDGSVVLGKDAKTPFSPAEWVESMRTPAPHWFPSSGSGTGAQQTTMAGGAKTITRQQYELLAPMAQREAIFGGVKVVDK